VTPTEHLESVLRWLTAETRTKYEQGQAEHGGNLAHKPGVGLMMEEEIIDLNVYFKTQRDQLLKMALDGKTAAQAYAYLYGHWPPDD